MFLRRIKGYIDLLRLHDYYGKTLIITTFSLAFSREFYGLPIIVILFLINLFNNAFAFGINDIEDAEDDALDPTKVKRNPLSAGVINETSALTVVAITALLCLSLSSIFNIQTLAFSCITLLVGFLYSYKPVRLKSIPFLDLLSHGFFLGSAQFLLPAIAMSIPITPAFIAAAASFYFMSIFGDIRNEIRDYVVDRETNIRNTASIIDLRKYERSIYFFQGMALTTLVYAGATNLSQPLRNQTMITLGTAIFLYLLVPLRIRKKIIGLSEPILVLGSGVILILILLESYW